MFRFQHFTINDHRCAQRVGTDAVLLGAWASLQTAPTILDAGTGSGVIALMLAQRFPQATITGIDIDPESIAQALENADQSPWRDRVTMQVADILTFEGSFTAIVSNPPFFERSLQAPDPRRNTARHTTALPLPALAAKASRLLTDGGTFSVVLPYDVAPDFIFQCQLSHLIPTRRCDIRTTPAKPFKRTLLEFTKTTTPPPYTQTTLTLNSPEYRALTADFYLN